MGQQVPPARMAEACLASDTRCSVMCMMKGRPRDYMNPTPPTQFVFDDIISPHLSPGNQSGRCAPARSGDASSVSVAEGDLKREKKGAKVESRSALHIAFPSQNEVCGERGKDGRVHRVMFSEVIQRGAECMR